MTTPIEGFSKLTKEQKIEWLAKNYTTNTKETITILKRYWNSDSILQSLHDEFIENTISNYYLPFGIAPNFLINNSLYAIPMAIEESSVVAAASKSAKFWLNRGGFKTTIIDTEKVGQVHFMYKGDAKKIKLFFAEIVPILKNDTTSLTKNMEKRGGGIKKIELRDKTTILSDYYQLHCTFETKDAMGANFINSCLEQFAETLKREFQSHTLFAENKEHLEVVMSILSNYVPNCLVRAEVSCPVEELNENKNISPKEFAEKIVRAVTIAKVEPYRAVTHNKGLLKPESMLMLLKTVLIAA